jgi:hypothetical protein
MWPHSPNGGCALDLNLSNRVAGDLTLLNNIYQNEIEIAFSSLTVTENKNEKKREREKERRKETKKNCDRESTEDGNRSSESRQAVA